MKNSNENYLDDPYGVWEALEYFRHKNSAKIDVEESHLQTTDFSLSTSIDSTSTGVKCRYSVAWRAGKLLGYMELSRVLVLKNWMSTDTKMDEYRYTIENKENQHLGSAELVWSVETFELCTDIEIRITILYSVNSRFWSATNRNIWRVKVQL